MAPLCLNGFPGRALALCPGIKFLAWIRPLTAQYLALWQAKERQAAQTLGPDWIPAMQGRGSQTTPRRQISSHAPLQKGRAHDVQPEFFGFSLVHVKQFKQLRRLQQHCRWTQRADPHPTDYVHGIALWNSILRASGFGSGFASWWDRRLYVSPLDPLSMPLHCPSGSVAGQIYDALLAEVRLLEQRLAQARLSRRRAQHEADRHLVFREVRRSPAAPVDSLLHQQAATVVRVDAEECAVELDQPLDLRSQFSVWIGGREVEVVHAEADKVWVTDVFDGTEQARCVQSHLVGDLRELFDAFHTQWRQRWCRHDSVPFSHWNELLAFARRVICPRPLQHLSLDAPLIRAEAAGRRSTRPLAWMVSAVRICFRSMLRFWTAWPVCTAGLRLMVVGPLKLWLARYIPWPRPKEPVELQITGRSQYLDFHIGFGAVSSPDTCFSLLKVGLTMECMETVWVDRPRTCGVCSCTRLSRPMPRTHLWLEFQLTWRSASTAFLDILPCVLRSWLELLLLLPLLGVAPLPK